MNYNLLESLQLSFQSLWFEVMQFLPELVAALIIIIVGWIIGNLGKSVIEKLFKTFNLTKVLDKAGVDTLSSKAGYQFKPAEFVGGLVKWFIIIVFVVVALDILNLNEVTNFFTIEILTYIPRVIVATLILLGAMALSNVVSASVAGAARAAGFNTADTIASFTRYAILVFAVLAALNQLEIATELVQLLFAGLVFGASLAFGLAFGLGGREQASRFIAKINNRHE